jgi:hypothetical protein
MFVCTAINGFEIQVGTHMATEYWGPWGGDGPVRHAISVTRSTPRVGHMGWKHYRGGGGRGGAGWTSTPRGCIT